MDAQRLVSGRYRLLSRLGAGGMGTVWRARDELLGREVAVKEVTFPPGVADAELDVLRERTRREARAAAGLDHPSAVTLYDVLEEDGNPYLVMELVEARTLAEVVDQDGPLSPRRAAQVGLALLGALEAAHARGILHRDVKPSNVLVAADGRVVLTDFGIATSTGDSTLTSTGMLLGSPAYIAPERARGEAQGPPSDLWSLGATLFTAVEGRAPYAGDQPLVTVSAVVTGEHAPFVAAGPLEPVLDGLLVKDPAARLDAPAARRLLQQVADRPETAPTTVLAAPVAPPSGDRTAALRLGDVRSEVAAAPPRRRGAVAAVVTGAVLLAVAGAALALGAGDDERDTPSPAALPSPAATPTAAPERSAPAPVRSPAPTAAPPTTPPTAPPTTAPPPPSPAPAAGPPAGWTTDTGRAGWTVALPPGYAQTRAGEYRQAGTGRTLRVDTGPGQPDAVADRERQEADFARRHPSYERIRIEPVDYRGYEAADWEFTYEGLHVINRVFVVDGLGHSLFFQTRAGDFAQAREDFVGIAAAFDPVGG